MAITVMTMSPSGIKSACSCSSMTMRLLRSCTTVITPKRRRTRKTSTPRTCISNCSFVDGSRIRRVSSATTITHSSFSTNHRSNSDRISSPVDDGANDGGPGELTPSVLELVNEYAAKPQKFIPLDELIRIGQHDDYGSQLDHRRRQPVQQLRGRMGHRLASERVLMQYAQTLQKELPISLARRVIDLDRIPKLRDMPSVQSVKRIYVSSLLAILDAEDPGESPLSEESFGQLLGRLYRKHSTVLLQMAQGAHEFRQLSKEGQIPGTTYDRVDDPTTLMFQQHDECQAFLERFFSSRVGIRVLAGQYLALRDQLLQLPSSPIIPEEYVGMICKRTSPYRIVNRAVQDATRLCEDLYGFAPTVSVRGRVDLTFSYFPAHLHYIVLELIKNGMRATVDFHKDRPVMVQSSLISSSRKQNKKCHGASNNIPPMTIIISDSPNNEDVVIKVCDEGGGIPRSRMAKIWSYLFTTANPDVQESVLRPLGGDDEWSTREAIKGPTSPILAGLGVGLPLARSYARYFGGDLDLISLEGYGTDAYLYLPRLTADDEGLIRRRNSYQNDDSIQRIQKRRTSLQI